VTMRPVKVIPPRKVQVFKKGKTMKPRVELVEDRATRAYFRRYGDSAQQPNRQATKCLKDTACP
jgi:hypothetical protein